MERCVEGLRDIICVPYLDDLIVFSSDFNSHLHHLKQVFARLRDRGIKLKPRKCNMFKNEVNYLGHVISEEGYWTDDSNIKVINALKDFVPKTVGDVRRVLGLLNYYRKYIKNFAQIAKPLFELTQWSTVKGKLCSRSTGWENTERPASKTTSSVIEAASEMGSSP